MARLRLRPEFAEVGEGLAEARERRYRGWKGEPL